MRWIPYSFRFSLEALAVVYWETLYAGEMYHYHFLRFLLAVLIFNLWHKPLELHAIDL